MKELAKPALLTLLVNERSGGGRAGRQLPAVARRLADGLPGFEIHVVRSSSWEDAEQLTRAAALGAQDGDLVVVMGGDGMAHLGLNACAHTDATLGIVPAGTGNDFARALGIPAGVHDAVESLVTGHTVRVDLNRISNERYPTRYVGAAVSSGYDARVNRSTNQTRLKFGALTYGWVALRELAEFEALHYELVVDGVEREVDAMIVAVCNTGMVGGGMRIAPDADPTDGRLDVTLVHDVPRTRLLRLLPQLYSGNFVRHPAVERFRATEIRINGTGLFVMGDGEELGDVPVTVTSDAGALRVRLPESPAR